MGNILVLDHVDQRRDETAVFVPCFETLLKEKHDEHAEAIQASAHSHIHHRGPITSQRASGTFSSTSTTLATISAPTSAIDKL